MNYKILNGNELLIQGALEAGFQLYTGYPGSPLADFFNILHEEKENLHAKGIRVVISNSEANAAAMASGAKMAGQNVLVAMKSMGLHVASDALSVGNFANPGSLDSNGKKAGVVIAVGDDPWSISTSTPADSRYLFKHLHIPFLEPSTPQELKDWMKVALEISQESSVYVGILLTTFMAEGGGRVSIGEEKIISQDRIVLEPSDFDLTQNVMVPPNSFLADKEMILRRFPRVKEVISKKGLDKEFGNKDSEIGIISSGATFETLKQVLEESELLEGIKLYKVASSYTLNESALIHFLSSLKSLIVVEEKRGFLEGEIRELISKEGIQLKVFGKQFQFGEKSTEGFPAFGGLSYEVVYQKLYSVLEFLKFDQKIASCEKSVTQLEITLPKRLPTFCPGCPHRETLSIMKDIRKILSSKNINLISHGDVGCYSLSFLEPFKEMHDLSAMGQGGALGAGADLFTANPSVVLMGDSTFFHSGMVAISNSVQMNHNITYILLDNDNTAMTGHQVTPRTGLSVEGDNRPRQSMLEVAKSLRVDEAIEVNPSDRYFYKNLLLDLVQKPGVKVVVSNKECGLTFHGRLKREERKIFSQGETQKQKSFYQINTLACEDCRECVEMTGCPGLSQTFDAYGTKVMIDPQICVSDSYCTKIKACPSFELVNVNEFHPTKYQKSHNILDTEKKLPIPDTVKNLAKIASGQDFRAVVIGVGGSGVTTISRVLAEASSVMDGRDDLNFKFVDQKGLAQRNGSVSSHLSIFHQSKSHGQVNPLGSCDLVISPDLLEGARAVNFLAQDGLLIIDSDYQVPLSILLERGVEQEVVDQEKIRNELQLKLGRRLVMAPLKKISFERFHKPVYASTMTLGIAYQLGRLPFQLESLREAIKTSVPKAEFESNWEAFEMGREWVLRPNEIVKKEDEISVEDFKHSLKLVALPWQRGERFIEIFSSYLDLMKKQFDFIPTQHLAHYLHDLIVYDQGKNLSHYYQEALNLKKKYSNQEELKIALRVLTKTFWVKDEVFVSHVMVSPIKKNQDKKRYGKLGSSFSVMHINRPSFVVFGKKIEFDYSPKQWQLHFMRHLRILRKLLPEWHKKEREINNVIFQELSSTQIDFKRLRELDNIKGYREIRYESAKRFLGRRYE